MSFLYLCTPFVLGFGGMLLLFLICLFHLHNLDYKAE